MNTPIQVLLLVLPFLLATASFGDASDDRPNIVFIVVEDLSPRIGAFGDAVAATPNLDQLAEEGVRYTNVFTSSGVCAPSRAALITGMHQQSIGAQHMRTSSFGRTQDGELGEFSTPGPPYETVPPPDVKAFPELLRAAGYFTLNNSKTDYQFGEPFTVWDVHSNSASLRDRDPGKPFFFMYSTNLTHESGLFRPGWANKQERSAAMVERNARRLALLDSRTAPDDVVVPAFLPDTLEVRKEIALLYDNVQLMDRWVGERIDELEAEGLLDNTIVVWTTDHGDGLPRGKRSLYDSGLHVPMIIRFPAKRAAGGTNDDLISFVDFAPTFLVLAGAAIPDRLHGRNFLDNVSDKRSYIYAARDRLDEFPDRSRAVRDDRYKYIRNYDPDRPFFLPLYYRENLSSMAEMRRLLRAGELPDHIAGYFESPRPAEELYDVLRDPQEIDDLATDPVYREDLQRLRAEMDRWLKDAGDRSVESEVDMLNSMWPGGEQPNTSEPDISVNCAADSSEIEMSSSTAGASIGYRFAGDEGWSLYTAPVRSGPGAAIEAKAIRYGYRESAVIRKDVCDNGA